MSNPVGAIVEALFFARSISWRPTGFLLETEVRLVVALSRVCVTGESIRSSSSFSSSSSSMRQLSSLNLCTEPRGYVWRGRAHARTHARTQTVVHARASRFHAHARKTRIQPTADPVAIDERRRARVPRPPNKLIRVIGKLTD